MILHLSVLLYSLIYAQAVVQCPLGRWLCPGAAHRCILDNWLCDGVNDCDDGADEAICGQLVTTPAASTHPVTTREYTTAHKVLTDKLTTEAAVISTTEKPMTSDTPETTAQPTATPSDDGGELGNLELAAPTEHNEVQAEQQTEEVTYKTLGEDITTVQEDVTTVQEETTSHRSEGVSTGRDQVSKFVTDGTAENHQTTEGSAESTADNSVVTDASVEVSDAATGVFTFARSDASDEPSGAVTESGGSAEGSEAGDRKEVTEGAVTTDGATTTMPEGALTSPNGVVTHRVVTHRAKTEMRTEEMRTEKGGEGEERTTYAYYTDEEDTSTTSGGSAEASEEANQTNAPTIREEVSTSALVIDRNGTAFSVFVTDDESEDFSYKTLAEEQTVTSGDAEIKQETLEPTQTAEVKSTKDQGYTVSDLADSSTPFRIGNTTRANTKGTSEMVTPPSPSQTEDSTTEPDEELSTASFFTTNQLDLKVSSWGEWSQCDALCNSGSQQRSRVCVGRCEDVVLEERRVCNSKPCPSSDCPKADQFRCKDYSRRCISYQYVCDGMGDCPGLSDETSCIGESHVVVDPVYQVGKVGGKVMYSVILYDDDKRRVETVVWAYLQDTKPVPIPELARFQDKYRLSKAHLRLTLDDLEVEMGGDFSVTIKFTDGTIKSTRISLLVLQDNSPSTTEAPIENVIEDPTLIPAYNNAANINDTFYNPGKKGTSGKGRKECEALECIEKVSEDCTRCICGTRVLFIYITAQNDDKVIGASVFVGPHGAARIGQSNRDGWVMLTGLCEGDSNLIIHKEGYEDYYLNNVSVQRAGYSAIMVVMKQKTKYNTPPNTPAQLWRGMFQVKNMAWEKSLQQSTTLEYQGLYQLFQKHLTKLYSGYLVKVRDIYFMNPQEYQYSQRLSAFRRGGGDNSKLRELKEGMIVKYQMVVIPGQDTEVLRETTQSMIESGRLSESIEILTDWMRFFQVDEEQMTEEPTERPTLPMTEAPDTECINDWGDDNCAWFRHNHAERFHEWCSAAQTMSKCRKMCGNCHRADLTLETDEAMRGNDVTGYFIEDDTTDYQEALEDKTEDLVEVFQTTNALESIETSTTLAGPGPDNLEFNRVTGTPAPNIQTEKSPNDLATPENDRNEATASSSTEEVSESANCEPCDAPKYKTDKFNFGTTEEIAVKEETASTEEIAAVEEITTELKEVIVGTTESGEDGVNTDTFTRKRPTESGENETHVTEMTRMSEGTVETDGGVSGARTEEFTERTTRAPVSTQEFKITTENDVTTGNDLTTETENGTVTSAKPTEFISTEVITTEVITTEQMKTTQVTCTWCNGTPEKVRTTEPPTIPTSSGASTEEAVTTEVLTTLTEAEAATVTEAYNVTERLSEDRMTTTERYTEVITTEGLTEGTVTSQTPEQNATESVTTELTSAVEVVTERFTSEGRSLSEGVTTLAVEVTSRETEGPASTVTEREVRTTVRRTNSPRVTTDVREETTEARGTTEATGTTDRRTTGEVTDEHTRKADVTSAPHTTLNRATTTPKYYSEQEETTSQDTLLSTELRTVELTTADGQREETSEAFSTTSTPQEEGRTTSQEGIDPTKRHSEHVSEALTSEVVREVSTSESVTQDRITEDATAASTPTPSDGGGDIGNLELTAPKTTEHALPNKAETEASEVITQSGLAEDVSTDVSGGDMSTSSGEDVSTEASGEDISTEVTGEDISTATEAAGVETTTEDIWISTGSETTDWRRKDTTVMVTDRTRENTEGSVSRESTTESATEEVTVPPTEMTGGVSTNWRRNDSTNMATERTRESTTSVEEATTTAEEVLTTEETVFVIPTGFLNEKSRPALRTQEPTVPTEKKETKPFSLISDDSTSSAPRVLTTTEFTTASVFDHTDDQTSEDNTQREDQASVSSSSSEDVASTKEVTITQEERTSANKEVISSASRSEETTERPDNAGTETSTLDPTEDDVQSSASKQRSEAPTTSDRSKSWEQLPNRPVEQTEKQSKSETDASSPTVDDAESSVSKRRSEAPTTSERSKSWEQVSNRPSEQHSDRIVTEDEMASTMGGIHSTRPVATGVTFASSDASARRGSTARPTATPSDSGELGNLELAAPKTTSPQKATTEHTSSGQVSSNDTKPTDLTTKTAVPDQTTISLEPTRKESPKPNKETGRPSSTDGATTGGVTGSIKKNTAYHSSGTDEADTQSEQAPTRDVTEITGDATFDASTQRLTEGKSNLTQSEASEGINEEETESLTTSKEDTQATTGVSRTYSSQPENSTEVSSDEDSRASTLRTNKVTYIRTDGPRSSQRPGTSENKLSTIGIERLGEDASTAQTITDERTESEEQTERPRSTTTVRTTAQMETTPPTTTPQVVCTWCDGTPERTELTTTPTRAVTEVVVSEGTETAREESERPSVENEASSTDRPHRLLEKQTTGAKQDTERHSERSEAPTTSDRSKSWEKLSNRPVEQTDTQSGTETEASTIGIERLGEDASTAKTETDERTESEVSEEPTERRSDAPTTSERSKSWEQLSNRPSEHTEREAERETEAERVGTDVTASGGTDVTSGSLRLSSGQTEGEALLTVEATTEAQTEPPSDCILHCMSGSTPTAACDGCVCSRGRNYTLQIRDYNRNYLTRAVVLSQIGEILGYADKEGLVEIAETCYTQVTVSQSPVYKSQAVVLRYSKTRPVLSVYLESNRETRCPAASFDCSHAAQPECYRDSDCQLSNGKCCMSDCTHKCVSSDGLL